MTDVRIGSWVTRDGSHASVWEPYEFPDKSTGWRGTVRGVGITEWTAEGKDAYGTEALDLLREDSGGVTK